jgi:hypothetical protein
MGELMPKQKPEPRRARMKVAELNTNHGRMLRMEKTMGRDAQRHAEDQMDRTREKTQGRKRQSPMKGAAPMPSAGHKSFAKNTEGFDGASLADRPPHMSIPRGNPTPDAIPSATGTPALAQRTDGTANLRATTVTKQTEVRSVPAGKRGPSLPQSFNDRTV